MKMKLSILCFFILSLSVFSENTAVTKSSDVSGVVPKSVVNIKNVDYLSDNEFNEILNEAEKKLKMDKDKKKRLSEYFFELLDIKRAMYPHESFKTVMTLAEFKEKYPDRYLAIMNKEIELNPKNPHAYLERASAYRVKCLKEKDLSKGREYCFKAIKDLSTAIGYATDKDMTIDRIPLKMYLHLTIGDIYMNINDYEKAVFYYTKAIELDRIKPSQIHFERATAYLYLGKMDKAIEDLKLFNKTPYFTEKEKKERFLPICYCLYFRCSYYPIPENFRFDNRDNICPSEQEVLNRYEKNDNKGGGK
jgi:tetratricopeptide (TPR) repeat protein